MEDNDERTTAKDSIIKSCRSFVQTLEGATSELDRSIITNMNGLTKTEERKCKLFLQKTNMSCREVMYAAGCLLQSYVDDELTSDYDADICEQDVPSEEIKIKQDPSLDDEQQSDDMFFIESLGSAYAAKNNSVSADNLHSAQSVLFNFQSMDTFDKEGNETVSKETKPSVQKPTKVSATSRKRKGEPKKCRKPVKKKPNTREDDSEADEYDPKPRKARKSGGSARKRWPCDKCENTVFKTRALLWSHQEQQHGIVPQTVKRTVKSKKAVEEETQKEFECELCHKTFRLYRDFFRHRKFIHPDHFYKHGGLEEEAANMSWVKQVDMSNIRVDKDNIVSLVPPPDIKPEIELTTEAAKPKEKLKQVEGQALVCDVCGKTCKTKTLLKLHIKTHTLAYQCNTCGKRYATSSQLTYHERIHTGEKPHKCDQCNMSFRYSTLLNTHMFTFHCTIKPYQCDQCSESFRFKKTLGVHMVRRHSSVRPYSCGICDKKFVEKVYYRLHMKQHAGVRDHKCDQCDSTFCTQPGLSKHKRMVHSEKHIVCHVCAKAFSHQSRLNSHMRVHSDEKKYSCETCGKRFAWGHLLKQHMRTHTGEKPYKCEICDRQFLCSGNLTKHRKTHR